MRALAPDRMKIGLKLAVALAILGGAPAEAAEGDKADLVNRRVLRVCADPSNIPFSNRDEAKPGFENKLADIVAQELGNIPVEYTWFPQATGFIRRTLFAKACDIVMGYAQGDELVLNTNHYYRSTYVLVFPKGSELSGVETLSDPKLQGKRIGVVAGTPPATVMSRVGLMATAKPYALFVDRRYDSPAEAMLADIKSGEIAGGVLWGPNAGYFAKGIGGLEVVPLLKEGNNPRMSYRITMGVRQSDDQWKRELNEIIAKRQGDIDQVLLDFGVPLIDEQDKLITAARK
ncbi:MAG: substrate-binding domain-containing protein [Hyphomicrobiaceae bacterium]|nr:substrate-binding domain-containing protein [Hyphomicrobiaceae bacterium]